MSIITRNIRKTKTRTAQHALHTSTTVLNPLQKQAMSQWQHIEHHLSEDRRLLTYGLDVMRLMTTMVAYHNALRTYNADVAKTAWRKTEAVASRLESYYIPLSYAHPGPGFFCKDALRRSQLMDVIARCRLWRSQNTVR